jgi:hypothetical protein
LEDRQDWRGCVQTEDEEKEDAMTFRKEFEADQAVATEAETSV